MIDDKMRGAILRNAVLSDANLQGVDLSGADLRGADLRGANLTDANLTGAILTNAILSDADLRGAILSGADLTGANLRGANVQHCKWVLSVTLSNYTLYCYHDRHGVRFTAGCRRSLTLLEARYHWASYKQNAWTDPTPEYGARMLRAVEFLVAEARALGWPVDEEV